MIKYSAVEFQMPKPVSTFSFELGALLSNPSSTFSVMESELYKIPLQEIKEGEA